MLEASKKRLGGLLAVLFVAWIAVGVVRSIDVMALSAGASRACPEPTTATAKREVHHAGSGRLFVLMVDSLRYETATDPLRMPHLAGLRERSTYAKTLSSRDAVTVSALRAAFTGHDGFSVLGFVKNYWRGDAKIDSLFRQAHAASIPTDIYSDGSFEQFGGANADYEEHEAGSGSEMEKQNRGAEAALDDFVSHAHDLVVFHLTYSDHAAHAYGVGNERYDAAFGEVDDVIAKIDAKIPASDTFLVMGDHGHDMDGRHALGLDIPTYTSYRGPGFRSGLDLGTISIVEHRYLASWALGLPLDASYDGARNPEALVSVDEAPSEYREASGGASSAGGALASHQRAGLIALVTYLGLLVAVFFVYFSEILDRKMPFAPWMHAWAWFAIAPLYLPEWGPGSAALGCLLGGTWVVLATQRASLTKRLALLVVPPLAALALTAWGYELAVHRVDVHEPLIPTLETLWGIAAITGALLSLLYGAMNVAWGFLAITAGLFYPTVYQYGSPGTMALVWCTWLLFLGVEHVAAQLRLFRRGPLLVRAISTLATLVPGGLAALLLLPFSFPAGNNFHFNGWAGAFSIHDAPTWFVLALVSNVFVFVRLRGGLAVVALGVAGVAFVTCLETWPSLATGMRGALLVGGLAIVATLLSRRGKRSGSAETVALARVAWLACLEAASFYFIRVPLEAHQTADALFAAISLTAALVVRLPRAKLRDERHTFLLLLGLLAAGWATLAWTAHRLEWTFLYEWLPAAAVERHVGLLSPLLLGRYAIPVLIVRTLLAERLGASGRATTGALYLALLKILALTALLAGIGCVSALSNVYIEAVEEAAIFLLLAVGFVGVPGVPPSD